MESYSLKAVLSVADQGFTSKIKNASNALDTLDVGSRKATAGIMDIAKGVGVFKALAVAGNAMKESLGGAIDRFDTMNRFPKVMENMGFSAESSTKSIQKLSSGIQGLPTSLDGIAASAQNIAVLTGNLDKATDTSLALNNAFLASGAVTADAERGLTQYVQMLSKGTVDMQSWRTLQETMGYALSETAKELGIASGNSLELYSALQSGSVSFDQFNNAMIECSTRTGGFAEKAKTASAGIKTSFGNLGIAVTRGMANTIQSVNDTMNQLDGSSIQGKIESVRGAVDSFFVGTARGAAVAVQALDMLTPSLAAATGGFIAFKTAMAVQDQYAKLKTAMDEAKTTIDAFRNAETLATQAKFLSEKATQRQELAERLGARARDASMRALKSETAAKELSAAATKARTAADKAAAAETKVRIAEEKASVAITKLKVAEEKAAATATKSKAVQEKAAAAVTKAKANVDKASVAVETAKANAAKAGATASELNAKAEGLETAATKAKVNADKDAIGASIAKANANKAETFASEANAAAEAKTAAAEEAGNIVKAKSSMLVIAKTAVLAVLSGELGIVAAAQWAWNAAVSANKLGLAIVVATAFAAAIAGVVKVLKKLDTEQQKNVEQTEKLVDVSKQHTDAVESSSKAYQDNISDIEASVKVNKDLAGKIADLSAKENKSVQDKAELRAHVDSLNASMEGLNLQYDAEKDALSMTTDAILDKVAAYEQEAKAQAYRERYVEVAKEQVKIEEDLNNVTQRKKDLQEEYLKGMQNAPAALGRYNEAAQDLSQTEEELKAKKQELAQSEEYLQGVMVESQQAQADAVQSSAEAQKLSLEDTKGVVESMKETWQSYADHTTNMFDTISSESELSVEQMTANLLENQRVVGEWANNIDTLAQRGIDQGLLEQLRQAGPESAGYVNAMVQASDIELQQLSSAFANGGQMATDALKTVFDTSNVPESAMNMITGIEESISNKLMSADWESFGQYVGQGLGNGIQSGTPQAAAAASNMGQGVNDAAANVMGINSPSTVFIGYGENLIQGLVIGIQGRSGMLNAAMEMAMTSAGQTAVNAINSQLTDMSGVTKTSFAKIVESARTSMSQTASITEAGMKTISTSVKNSMRDVQSRTVSGMNQFTRAIDNGVNRSISRVNQGCSSMVSLVSALQSSFYSSGYNASLGLANGVHAGAGAAIAAARSVANQVAAIMASALKEHSPSRVTRKIGAFATEGLALGILDDIDRVKRATLEVAQAAVPVGGIADHMAYAGTYTPSFSYEYTGNVEATYTIIVPVEIEGREVAKATATFTQEELDKLNRRNRRKRGDV